MTRTILAALAAVAFAASTALMASPASAAPKNVQLNNKFVNKLPPKIVHPNFPKKQPPKIVHWPKPVIVHKPIIVRYPVVRHVPVVYAAKPVAGPCTCLTKQYTPEGAVVFKDICTNEAAINPPPQAPQQTGLLQVQPQADVQVQPQQ